MSSYHCGCPACAFDAESLGPIQGCEPPPPTPAELVRMSRWSMTPAEWAGEEPCREPD